MRTEYGFNRFLGYYQTSEYQLKVKNKGSIATANGHCCSVYIVDFE